MRSVEVVRCKSRVKLSHYIFIIKTSILKSWKQGLPLYRLKGVQIGAINKHVTRLLTVFVTFSWSLSWRHCLMSRSHWQEFSLSFIPQPSFRLLACKILVLRLETTYWLARFPGDWYNRAPKSLESESVITNVSSHSVYQGRWSKIFTDSHILLLCSLQSSSCPYPNITHLTLYHARSQEYNSSLVPIVCRALQGVPFLKTSFVLSTLSSQRPLFLLHYYRD